MGCNGYHSEWGCIEALGIDKVQSAFENHWWARHSPSSAGVDRNAHPRSPRRDTFYTLDDFTEMASVGLNTVRIPLGCASPDPSRRLDSFLQLTTAPSRRPVWTVDSLIGDDHFPRGSWKYVKQVVAWCKEVSGRSNPFAALSHPASFAGGTLRGSRPSRSSWISNHRSVIHGPRQVASK
jgi:hypothetical protein